jgi:hypothetical protein
MTRELILALAPGDLSKEDLDCWAIRCMMYG